MTARDVTGFSWPTLLFTLAGLWVGCYAAVRAFEAPVRVWDDDDDNSADAAGEGR